MDGKITATGSRKSPETNVLSSVYMLHVRLEAVMGWFIQQYVSPCADVGKYRWAPSSATKSVPWTVRVMPDVQFHVVLPTSVQPEMEVMTGRDWLEARGKQRQRTARRQ